MNEPQKMKLTSMDIADDKQEQLKTLFPEVFNEGKIDFDQLKRVLGEWVEPGKERFGLQWPGKAECMKIIQQPSVATLKPCREESVNFDETENLFIEGDNLEVLKLLQKSYFGKIKMIYIDPPYNTGKEFIYPDKYSETLDTYLAYTNQVDDAGKKFSTNTEAQGRFHSRWLNMMYPRLYLARNLLSEDGVIFLNIGEEEQFNLEKLSNEIFGEENKITTVSRVSKTASNLGSHFASSLDYILVYSKHISSLPVFKDKVDETLYTKTEISGPRAGDKYRDDVAFYQSSQKDLRPNQKYFIECPDGEMVIPPCSIQDEIMREGDGRWRWAKETYLKKNELLVFKQTKTSPLLNSKGAKASWNIYTKSYLSDRQEDGVLPRNIFTDFINRKGADLLKRMEIPFDFSKPVELIQYLISIIDLNKHDILLDFFAGSSTLAHAVLEQNKLDNGSRKFICVQLPEPCEEKSEAKNAGYKTIADISKERIRRVIKKIKNENESKLNLEGTQSLDLGFKAFRLDRSNFKVWEGGVEKISDLSEQLSLHVDHISKKSTPEDILYELLLKAGFSLTTKIKKLTMADKQIFSIEDGAMLICLEKEITPELIDALAEAEPLQVICLDEAFKSNDQLKANAVQTFKARAQAKESEIVFRTV